MPVNAPDSSSTPIPIMRAIPVTQLSQTSPKVVPPLPRINSSATPTPTPTPFAPYQHPSSDPEGSIRLAPSTTGDPAALTTAQLELAEGFYKRKQPEAAIPAYEKFLIMGSKDALEREMALYHLAESQRLMGSTAAAESSFQRLIEESPSSEFKAAAEFRLGELNQSEGNLLSAADSFAHAALSTKDDAIILAAHFREALCREQSGQQEKANALFELVVKGNGGKTPKEIEVDTYQIPSLFHLAAAAQKAGNKEAALAWYSQILSLKTTGNSYAEASVKAALILSELGRMKEARKLFDTVADSKDSAKWQSIAALASLRIASQSGDQATVLKMTSTALAGTSDDKPEILLLQADALRKTGKISQALVIYDTIMREYPGSKAAALAPFQRLLGLHAIHAESLLTEIDQYLLTASDPADRSKAELLRAEETLHLGKYKEAANLYHQLDTASLSPSSKTDLVYKEAWALTQSGDQDGAITALTRFLDTYPNDERASTALAQRALLKQQKKDLSGALADFSQLDQHYPKAAERELALQQKALLLGQQQDNKGMVTTFTQLLNDYPKSAAANQAHYWIGWVAMENKDYATALAELSQARVGDPKQFGERAGIRILLAYYYLNQPSEAAREAATLPASVIPAEVGRWLGVQSMESGNPAKAEKFLSPLVAAGLPGSSDADIQSTLALALIAQGKYKAAQLPASVCLKLARDPASRAKALLMAASIQHSMKNFSQASSMIDEAMLLQPEGPINAEARILSGDLMASRQDYSGAAKAYITVAVLSDDPIQAPKALTKAIEAYRRAGNYTEAEKTVTELQKRFPHAPIPQKSTLPKETLN
jgi:TolA-binding protein